MSEYVLCSQCEKREAMTGDDEDNALCEICADRLLDQAVDSQIQQEIDRRKHE